MADGGNRAGAGGTKDEGVGELDVGFFADAGVEGLDGDGLVLGLWIVD